MDVGTDSTLSPVKDRVDGPLLIYLQINRVMQLSTSKDRRKTYQAMLGLFALISPKFIDNTDIEKRLKDKFSRWLTTGNYSVLMEILTELILILDESGIYFKNIEHYAQKTDLWSEETYEKKTGSG